MKLKTKEMLRIFAFPIAIFIVHVSLLVPSGIYDSALWFDIPMHFLGGLAVGLSYFTILRKGYLGKLRGLQEFIIAISFVGLTAVLWEFAEFAVDLLFAQTWQTGLEDTMADMALGLTGGLFAGIIRIITTHKSL